MTLRTNEFGQPIGKPWIVDNTLLSVLVIAVPIMALAFFVGALSA